MTNSFSGYLALGTSTTTTVWTELTGATGYSRQVVTLSQIGLRRHVNLGPVTFAATAAGWATITQVAFCNGTTGTPLFFWNLTASVSVPNGGGYSLAASQLQFLFADAFNNAGVETIWDVGAIVGLVNSMTMYVSYPFQSNSGVVQPNKTIAGLGSRIATLYGANLNATGDQVATMVAPCTQYALRHATATNGSGNVNAQGGIYPAASKGGTAIVAATQSFATLTASNVFVDCTLSTAAATTVYVNPPILNLTNVTVGAGTCDIHFFGDILA